MNKIFLNSVLNIFQNNIIPLTTKRVSLGNKIFGAAIIKKNDLSLVISGSNNEIENPLWHGEISTIKNFYEIIENKRPFTKDCFFISSHEPCSLCLSAITWCGFDNFFYLFPHNSTINDFNIPHDLKILKEVFNIDNGEYARKNYYWKSYNLNDLIIKLSEIEKKELMPILENIKNTYKKLSDNYQLFKKNNKIPLK